jgi:tetratricopeptide (TPR) repeat protein
MRLPSPVTLALLSGALLPGCAHTSGTTDACSRLSLETGHPARRHSVLAVFRYARELDDLPSLKQRACALGADALILSKDVRLRSKPRLAAGPPFADVGSSLGILQLPLAVVFLVAGLEQAIDASTREKYPWVATAVRWTGEPTDRVRDASPTSTLRTRVTARSKELRARLDAHPEEESALAEFLAVSEETGDRASARAAFERFLAAAPPSPEQRLAYATWLWHHDFEAEALVEARAVRALTPLPRGASSLLGQLLGDAGQGEDARAELERALLEDPEDEDARAALQRLGAPR